MSFLEIDCLFYSNVDLSESELEKLSIIIGFNQSDTTYGWNGKTSGFTLHYLHFTDIIEEHGHSFPLSPGLIPIVYFQNVQKIFLGEPFTKCKPTRSVNNYTTWRRRISRQSRLYSVFYSSDRLKGTSRPQRLDLRLQSRIRNNFDDGNANKDIYKISQCVTSALMKQIAEYCTCYLSYVTDIHRYINITGLSGIDIILV